MRQFLLMTAIICNLAGQASAQVAEEDLFQVDPAVREHKQLTVAAEAGQKASEAHVALLDAKKAEAEAQLAYDKAVAAAVEKVARVTSNQAELELVDAHDANRALIEAKAKVVAARATFEAKQKDYVSAVGTAGIEALTPAKQKEIEMLAENFKDLFAQVEALGKKMTVLEEKVMKLEARDDRTTTWCTNNAGTSLCEERAADLQTQ